jgi:hypothetical protein
MARLEEKAQMNGSALIGANVSPAFVQANVIYSAAT